jgi:hypothetical protein
MPSLAHRTKRRRLRQPAVLISWSLLPYPSKSFRLSTLQTCLAYIAYTVAAKRLDLLEPHSSHSRNLGMTRQNVLLASN